MAFDALLSRLAEHFREGLSDADRAEFDQAVQRLMDDPFQDSQTKVYIGGTYPYLPGTYAFYAGDFVMTYFFHNPNTIGIADASWRYGSPRYQPRIFPERP